MTPSPAPDDAKSVPVVALEVVTDDPAPRRTLGRPVIMTKRRFLAICHLIEQGNSCSASCRIQQVSYTRFREVVSRSKRLTERLKRAQDTCFQLRCDQALECVMRATYRDSWVSAAGWLERNLPHLYALRTVHRESKEPEAEPELLPAEILARHRELQLALLREDTQSSG